MLRAVSGVERRLFAAIHAVPFSWFPGFLILLIVYPPFLSAEIVSSIK
jgi:hypothetical protein